MSEEKTINILDTTILLYQSLAFIFFQKQQPSGYLLITYENKVLKQVSSLGEAG